MIKKTRDYILSAAVALSATSYLDKLPEDGVPFDNTTRSVSNVNQAVIGTYDTSKNSALHSGSLTLLPDPQVDFVYAINGYTNTYGNIWRWKDILATNTDIEAVYQTLYAAINHCNFMLDRADYVRKNTTVDADFNKLDQYYDEAYSAHALAYLELIEPFCKTYESDEEAANEPSAMLTEHCNGSEEMKRASLKDSYQFVLDDLNYAADLLELKDDFKGTLHDTTYLDEYAVYTLHAHVALYMRKWDDVIKYFDRMVGSNCYILASCTRQVSQGVNCYQYMWINDHSIEGIWKVGLAVNSYGGRLGTVFANYDFRNFRPDYMPAEWVIDLYDNNDLRVSSFFRAYATECSHGPTWPLLMKYSGNQDFTKQYNILHVTMPKMFRLSEQYLIRAEAYAQKDQPDYVKAGNNISTIHTIHYFSRGGSAAMNRGNAMDITEAERVKEFCTEGFHSQDLKRWRKEFKRKLQDQSLTSDSSLKAEKNDPLFMWPIPQHEFDSPGSQVEPNGSNK